MFLLHKPEILEVEKYRNHQRAGKPLAELFILCEREPVSVNLNFGVNDLKRSVEKEGWLQENHPEQGGIPAPSAALTPEQLLLLCN